MLYYNLQRNAIRNKHVIHNSPSLICFTKPHKLNTIATMKNFLTNRGAYSQIKFFLTRETQPSIGQYKIFDLLWNSKFIFQQFCIII